MNIVGELVSVISTKRYRNRIRLWNDVNLRWTVEKDKFIEMRERFFVLDCSNEENVLKVLTKDGLVGFIVLRDGDVFE